MKKRILFVDDEPKVLQGLQRALRSQTDVWDMAYVVDVAKATELLNQDQYDAVVLDCYLPDCRGTELLSDVRARCDAPVIVMTVDASAERVVDYLRAGAHHYLVKSTENLAVLALELERAIEDAARGASLERERREAESAA